MEILNILAMHFKHILIASVTREKNCDAVLF